MKHTFRLSLIAVACLLAALILFFVFSTFLSQAYIPEQEFSFWNFKSVDTMKYSRDLSREKLHDDKFTQTIDQQVKAIAQTGATHIAIATPYDAEFVPYLKEWVDAARTYHLHVWFRGNFSGWEGWFGYPKIDRATHIEKTKQFIHDYPDLFEDGDVFSACPECENGGPGDPRKNGDVVAYRKFLIDEYNVTQQSFKDIHKNVTSNYNSMNGDVARLVMDKATTKALGGIVVIDHYVATPEKMVSDIRDIAHASGGKVVLGEYGAPIPDINGNMTPEQQAEWLEKLYIQLIKVKELAGLNYWTNIGGTTQLWEPDGTVRPAVSVITRYYSPLLLQGKILGSDNKPLRNAKIETNYTTRQTDSHGIVFLPVITPNQEATISAQGYKTVVVNIDQQSFVTNLKPEKETLFYKFHVWLRDTFNFDFVL